MKRAWISAGALVSFWAALFGVVLTASALEEGEVVGTIERTNDRFLRNYESLEYGVKDEWREWGKGLRSLGWIVVRGDSGELKDYVLLVIDTRTEIEGKDAQKGLFSDLVPGGRVQAQYRMGWDALHALHVKRLDR
jgi:hypothetical protein